MKKSLDPNQNIFGIQRFLKLLHDEKSVYEAAPEISSYGKLLESTTIEITHAFIEEKIGSRIEASFIVHTLEKIGFGISEHGGMYVVTVPTFRATKDVGIKEDIVEEIVRFYGYSSVTPQLPEKETKAHSLDAVYRTRGLKQVCAYGMKMRELYNYAFFDESFLRELNWQPKHAVQIKNPVSENYQKLVTTLIPGLLKGIAVNHSQSELRFFEWGRVWEQAGAIIERHALAGVFFDKENIDFYAAKQRLSSLFDFLHMTVEWRKADEPLEPWFMPYQTAHLMVNGVAIGKAGKLDSRYLSSTISGEAFAFELDGDALLAYDVPLHRYTAPSRYPVVERDISLLVPLQLTVQEISDVIRGVDSAIGTVQLLDMFDKKEWKEKRSLTFRFTINAVDRTLTKEDADHVLKLVMDAVTTLGAEVR